jgi:hypothetical protein
MSRQNAEGKADIFTFKVLMSMSVKMIGVKQLTVLLIY